MWDQGVSFKDVVFDANHNAGGQAILSHFEVYTSLGETFNHVLNFKF